MSRYVLHELYALQELPTKALRLRFEEVLGETTASRNREYLVRKIADALQTAECARDKFARSTQTRSTEERVVPAVPSVARFDESCEAPPVRSASGARPVESVGVLRQRDPRLPPVGTVLQREFGGRNHSVVVLERGFEYEGVKWDSLSALAKHIAGGTSWNGYAFFRLKALCVG